jgi:Mce-associated membrane protein
MTPVVDEAVELEEKMTVPPWAAGLLVVLLVLALIGVGIEWHSAHQQRDRADAAVSLAKAARDAEATARTVAVEMTSYDYRSLTRDFAWIDDAGTAKFQSYFKDASTPVKTLVTSLQATSRGTVVDGAADATDTSHVRVVLFVDQRITSATESKPKIDQPRISMSMVRSGGKWLVDTVNLDTSVAAD